MVAILQTIFWDEFSWMKRVFFTIIIIFIKISQKFSPKGPIENNPALV